MSDLLRYTIVSKLTRGGTAEIFLAKQHGAKGFERTVVIKRSLTTAGMDLHFQQMLVDEAHLAMSLNHSNIVQVLDIGEAQGCCFLALELVDGWSLDRIVKRAQAAGLEIPPAISLYVIVEVCRALAYAHLKKGTDGKPLGIVHCDVNPHNVLISEHGEVKLTDFGFAQSKTRKTEGNQIRGTFAFMSPEQASAGELDARSDLFSVGTMLYAMIIGRHPFAAPDGHKTFTLVKTGYFRPPETARPGLDAELYRLIRRALGKLPAERYQTAEEMLVDVEQVMRAAFRPVGQTELQRWLGDLGAKDGVPPLARQAPTEPLATGSIAGPPVEARSRSHPIDGSPPTAVMPSPVITESSRTSPSESPGPSSGQPPVVGPTEVTMRPSALGPTDRAWHQRPADRIGIALAILLAYLIVGGRLMHARSRAGNAAAPHPAASPAATVQTAPAPRATRL